MEGEGREMSITIPRSKQIVDPVTPPLEVVSTTLVGNVSERVATDIVLLLLYLTCVPDFASTTPRTQSRIR